jgi:ParB family chromosome partitioning protein
MEATAVHGKRNALGKGIESLLGPLQAVAAAGDGSGKPLEIAVDKIEPNPHQTRAKFDESKLAELAKSIAASGVIQPVVVRELGGGRYQLIMGERRWRASQMAGKATIPAIVRQVSDEQAMEMTIIENLQRADLNPMEQARAFDKLAQKFQMTQEQMAARTGKDRATIGNFLRLLKLPGSIQMLVEGGQLSFGHARALLALDSLDNIVAASMKVTGESLSVRQTELYVQGLLDLEGKVSTRARAPGRAPVVAQDANVHEAQERLQRRLGLRVKIEDKQGRGRVIIEYAGVEDFDSLLEALGE